MIKKKGMKIMLELMKSYTKPEMSAMFGTRSMQGLQRKLKGMECRLMLTAEVKPQISQ